MSHTPGAWRIAEEMRGLNNVRVHGVEDEKGFAIANCGTGDAGARNARLIAAAPELLELLELALPSVEECEQFNKPTRRDLSQRIRAAIAKATLEA